MILDLIQKKEKLFTRVFYKTGKAQRSGKRFFVNYGSSDSSKSVSQHQRELINLMRANYDILIMRKVAADIYDSCYKLLESIAIKWGIYDSFEWTYSQGKRQILYKKTGQRIIFRGADDISKLKSIAGIGRIVLEEADAFEFEDFKEINRRARGYPNIQIVFILNPTDEEHWIKTMFWDDTGIYHPRTHIEHSTYHDNQFATEEDIQELELLKEIDEYDYQVYALGMWGRIKTGHEFYPHFRESVHVAPVKYIPSLPIHLTYDFNAVPYMTLLCIQYVERQDTIDVQVFSEYCLESPLNSSEAVSQAFVDDYEKYLQDIFFYGDASGNTRIAGKGDEVNYDDVKKVLYKWTDADSDRTRGANIGVMIRRKLVQKCLAGHLYLGKQKIRIIIDPSCVKTIEDFKRVKLGPNGKLQEKHKDKKTGVSWVKYGHCTDAFEYCFCELFDSLL